MTTKMVDSDGAVLVRVKSASHPSCEDIEFDCDPKMTSVRQVKEKIRSLYSFHPDIADQRLIYSGHLLDDLQLLTDVFGLNGASGAVSSQSYQHSGPYIIHLACTSKSYVSSSQRNLRRNDNHSGDTTSQSPVFSSQIPNPMMQDPRFAGIQGQPNSFQGNGIPPEFYALHQLYVEQMSAYMRNWNMAYGISNVNFPGGTTIPGPAANPNINLQGNIPQQQPAPANAPPQNERPRQAGNLGGLGAMVGGAAVNDDDENPRDLLDWAYTLSRVLLILSVVYFYSNFTRFLLVVIFTAAIAIFQRRPQPIHNAQAAAGANVPPAERQGNNNNNNNPVNAAAPGPGPDEINRNEPRPNGEEEPAPAQNNDSNNAEINRDTTDENPEAEAAEANVVAGAGQHRFAYYRDVTWTFLTTFFTSLIPEMPQHN